MGSSLQVSIFSLQISLQVASMGQCPAMQGQIQFVSRACCRVGLVGYGPRVRILGLPPKAMSSMGCHVLERGISIALTNLGADCSALSTLLAAQFSAKIPPPIGAFGDKRHVLGLIVVLNGKNRQQPFYMSTASEPPKVWRHFLEVPDAVC